MAIYKDTTFCIASAVKCINTDCKKYITEEQINEARQVNLPICWGDFYNPSFGLNCDMFKARGK